MKYIHNLKSQFLKRALLVSGLAFAFLPRASQAQQQFWRTNGTSGTLTSTTWGTSSSGSFTNAYAPGTTIVFSANSAITNVTNIVVGNMTVNNASNVQWTAAGTMNFGGTVRTLDVVDAGGVLDLAGQAISTASGTGIIKNGDGTLYLQGASYPGGFTLNAGTVVVGGVNALGSGSTLTINGGKIVAPATTSLAGKYSGGITIGGSFTLGGTTTGVSSGNGNSAANLTFDSTVNLGAAQRTINIGGAGTYTFSGVISGTSSDTAFALTSALSHATTGTMVWSGTGSNTFSGATEVNTGMLRLNKTSGAVAVPGTLNITGGSVTFVANEGQNQIADTASVVMTGQSLLNATTAFTTGSVSIQETISNLTMSGASGFVTGVSPTGWTITNSMSVTGGAGARFAASSGSTTKVGSLSLTNMTASAGDPIDPAVVADTPNTFTIYGNHPTVQTTFTVGSGGLSLNGSILNMRRGTTISLSDGSRLILDGNVTTSGSTASQIKFDETGDNGFGALSVDLSSTAGDIVRTITTAGGGADLTIGVAISKGSATTAGITKLGPGTLTLTAANTYNGTTTVEAGALVVASTGSLANNGITKILMAAPDDSLADNPVLTRPIAAGLNTYAGYGSKVTATSVDPVLTPTQSLQTTAEILMSGTNAAANNMTMQWRTRTAAEATASNPNAVLSDVLSLTDMGSDIFVLQMSYTDAALAKLGLSENSLALSGELRLGWKNGSTWTTAVAGNSSGTPMFAGVTPWLAYYNGLSGVDNGSDLASYLGRYGVDPENNVVWAVLNHNSEFAVIPEPSTLVFGGLTLLGLGRFTLRRRRLAA